MQGAVGTYPITCSEAGTLTASEGGRTGVGGGAETATPSPRFFQRSTSGSFIYRHAPSRYLSQWRGVRPRCLLASLPHHNGSVIQINKRGVVEGHALDHPRCRRRSVVGQRLDQVRPSRICENSAPPRQGRHGHPSRHRTGTSRYTSKACSWIDPPARSACGADDHSAAQHDQLQAIQE